MAAVLLIDDDASHVALYQLILEKNGHTVQTAAPASEFKLPQAQVDVVLLDYRLGGIDAAAIARAIKEQRPELPIITLTGFDIPPEAVKPYSFAMISKSSPNRLLTAIAEAASK